MENSLSLGDEAGGHPGSFVPGYVPCLQKFIGES